MIEYIITNTAKVVDRSFVISYIPILFASVTIVVLAIVIYKISSYFIKKILIQTKTDKMLVELLVDNVYKSIFVIGAFIAVLSQFGLDMKTSLTGVGVVSVVIGFAAKDSFSNIIAGLLIFLDKPFLVGDYITIEQYYGRVELITMRTTRIRTQDNKYVVIPNQNIINDVLVDHSMKGDTRIIVKVYVENGQDIERVRTIILNEIAAMDGVLKTPAPDVVVASIADASGVLLYVRVWIKNANKEQAIFFKTSEVVYNSLQKNGVTISAPHQTITLQK